MSRGFGNGIIVPPLIAAVRPHRTQPRRLRLNLAGPLPSARAFSLGVAAILLVSSVASGQSLRARIEEHHRVYVPPGAGKFATVVAIPGCSGVSLNSPATDEGRPGDQGDLLFRTHYPRKAERLRDAGFAVFLIDYLSAEHVINACSGEIALERIAEYIAESIAFARAKSFVDTDRIHIIGWSLGGRGLLAWLQALAEENPSVRSVIAVYAGCASAEPWKVVVPMLMLLGGADDIAPPDECQRLVASLPKGQRVSLRLYPGGRHGFDIEGAPPMVDVGGGHTIGNQPEAAQAAWREIVTFLGPAE